MSTPEISISPDVNPQTVSSQPAATIETHSDWKSYLAEDLRSDPALQDFKDINGLAKSYKSAQSMLGSSVRIPGPDASEEMRNEFYNKLKDIPGLVKLPKEGDAASRDAFFNALGRPETADGYNVKFDDSIAEAINPEEIGIFKQVAHSIGLTGKQAEALVAYQDEIYKSEIANLKQTRESNISALKQYWGNDFEVRAQAAEEMLNHMESKFPEAVNQLRNNPLRSNPVIAAALAELYSSMKEKGSVVPGTASLQFGVSASEARARLDEINRNRSHPYWTAKPGTAQRSEIQREVEMLHNIAASGE